ncbi:MoaD/ThiS family protein [Flavitalea sp.]|nr:MoaD/ThiS family protein [Flavitalea sp.]
MAITVLFFGQLVEITGSGELLICETAGIEDLTDTNEKQETNVLTSAKQKTVTNQIIDTRQISGTKELKELLLSRFPRLADIVFNIAVDTVIIEEDTRLKPGSIIALLPPFSGG